MALSDDQRAMLRLLAQREQGYEEMAALLGVSVEELRERVRAALAELEREGEQPPPLPPPPAGRHEPAVPRPAASRSSEVPPSRPAPPPAKKRKGRLPVPSSGGAKIGVAAVAAAVVILVVLLLTLGGGGSDSSTGANASNAATTAEGASGNLVAEALESTEAGKGEKEVTRAILSPADGGEAKGVAIFGRVKEKLALQVVAEGLEPLAKGDTYAIWIAASPQKMLPLAASPANGQGVIASRFEVPTEVLAYLANETFDEIAITRSSVSRLNASLKEATKSKRAPAYTGSAILRGTITGPIVGVAKRLKGR